MRVFCAYNVNIDAVTTAAGGRLSEIILSSDAEPSARMPESISSPGDFISGLLFCIRSGSGAELLVDSQDAAGFIEGAFDWSYRMGGNAGNAANALAELGAKPVVNVPSLTERQAEMFYPGVMVPGPGGKALLGPKEAARPGTDLIHFVIQFRGGLRVDLERADLGSEAVTAPRENRFIASFDGLNSRQYEDPDFESYAGDHLDEADGILIGGMHLATGRETLAPRLDEISYWKGKRPDLFIHCEMGSFQRPDIARYLVENISSDSIGMNDDELGMLERVEPGWRGMLDGAQRLRSRLSIPRICIHTKEYVVSASRGGLSPEREIESLTHGTDIAGALVATGSILRHAPAGLGPNPSGMAARDAFIKEMGAVRSGRGAYATADGGLLCLVPSLEVKSPVITVGLGDVMTAADFFCQVRARI